MWTRRTSKQAPPGKAAEVEAPPALDDSQYGVRSFEFGGEPRPDHAARPIPLTRVDATMHGAHSNDSDDSGSERGSEDQHETPMPAPRELAESPPRCSSSFLSTRIAGVEMGVEGVDERVEGDLEGAMSDMQRVEAGGESSADMANDTANTSGPTKHPAHSSPTVQLPSLPINIGSAHTSPSPVAPGAPDSPTYAIHSPNPSLASASAASASEIDTDTDLEHDTYDFDSDLDLDLSSAPPSPTSLTSMASVPSYGASVSSVSRSSSPTGLGYGAVEDGSAGLDGNAGSGLYENAAASGSVASAIARARRDRTRHGLAEGEGAELVIPELSLPSSSLHLSLREWTGPVQGVKVVLLGPAELTKRVIRAIGETEECVSVKQEGRGKGTVGVVRDGRMLGCVETGITAEQVRIRALRTYNTLHGLLNPASHEEQQLSEVVRAYSTREDWVHAVVGSHTVSRKQAETLNHLIPVLDTSTSSPISPLGGPTPMPATGADSSSYFDNPPPRILGDVNRVADAIIYAMIDTTSTSDQPQNEDIRSRSIATFLNWRPPALSSSNSSLDSQFASTPHSGASGLDMDADPAHLMPTVARAQGGGEWEATLSRRLAQRRASHQGGSVVGPDGAGAGVDSHTGLGTGVGGKDHDRPMQRRNSTDTRRMRSRGKKKNVDPLFPPRPLSPPTKSGYRSGKNGAAKGGRVAKGKSARSCAPKMGLGWTQDSGSLTQLGLGVSKLVSSTFQGMGKWAMGWRGAVVAAVVVGVVGLRLYFWQ